MWNGGDGREALLCGLFKNWKTKVFPTRIKSTQIIKDEDINIITEIEFHLVLHKTLLLHDLQSEIEVADFDRLLAKIEHVPIEHEEMRTLLIKVRSHIIRRLLTSKNIEYKSILEM